MSKGQDAKKGSKKEPKKLRRKKRRIKEQRKMKKNKQWTFDHGLNLSRGCSYCLITKPAMDEKGRLEFIKKEKLITK